MKNALVIFTRNPELGKCKTRLAKVIGDKSALEIYKYLLQHTANVSKEVDADRFVFYSESIQDNDIWDDSFFNKKLQYGNDLGERMQNAFQQLFDSNYKNVIIIGSDLLDLNSAIINKAFSLINEYDAVIGPAKDGGYYLLGLKAANPKLFKNKEWGTETVRRDTLNDLKNSTVFTLDELNDIDTFEDMKPYNQLKPYYSI
ncbi:TIGR04282 family arsenosugar biosynthesis glycosyltransferase [uncultured Winogradskyella sp.]|uniref:TIGR04282 family arsenosugar biosynthesis glycosyltransferase n=1 Tax=uncultured Winogradskyella sp. TaxID=395353 RepID=UPI0025D98CA5|nr:TIGR04282 family arsenosugar biosynthesis glycosyltransferase [uncultured Winogradskyella sp.]